MAKRGSSRPASQKIRDVLIDISSQISIQDDGFVAKAILQVMGESIPEIVLPNICKYCGPQLSRAANNYIKRYVVKYILKNSNIKNAIEESGDVYYRGALGIPKRFNYRKVKEYIQKTLTVEVTACGYNVGSTFARAAKRTKKAGEALSGKRKESTVNLIQTNLKNISEKAYIATAYRSGGRKNVYKRQWLREADTGETTVSGFSVFPGIGQTLEDLGPSPNGERGKYSRSGTHIMIPGGSYDPNDWRPDPSQNNIIEKTFIKYLPNIEEAVKKSVPQCLRRIKNRMQKDAERITKRRLGELVASTRGASLAQKEQQRLLGRGIEAVNPFAQTLEADIEELNIQKAIADIATEIKQTPLQVRMNIDNIIKISQGRMTIQRVISDIQTKLGI